MNIWLLRAAGPADSADVWAERFCGRPTDARKTCCTTERRMLDVTLEKTKLLNRTRGIRRQIKAVERALKQAIGCSDVLQGGMGLRG
jgi:hypothetical protein